MRDLYLVSVEADLADGGGKPLWRGNELCGCVLAGSPEEAVEITKSRLPDLARDAGYLLEAGDARATFLESRFLEHRPHADFLILD